MSVCALKRVFFLQYDDDESGELSLREFTRHAAARELKEFLAMEPVDSYSSGEEQEENFDDEESSEVQNEKIYSREANEDAAVLVGNVSTRGMFPLIRHRCNTTL